MGWKEANKAANNDWFAPYLGNLLDDPYDIVRLMAIRSLRKLPAYSEFEYDFLGSPETRKNTAQQVMTEWMLNSNKDIERKKRLLVTDDGKLDFERFRAFKAIRNDRPVQLVE